MEYLPVAEKRSIGGYEPAPLATSAPPTIVTTVPIPVCESRAPVVEDNIDCLRSQVFKILVDHCTHRHTEALQAFYNTPHNSDRYGDVDQIAETAMDYTDWFRRLLRISAGAERYRQYKDRCGRAGLGYSLDLPPFLSQSEVCARNSLICQTQ